MKISPRKHALVAGFAAVVFTLALTGAGDQRLQTKNDFWTPVPDIASMIVHMEQSTAPMHAQP